MARTTAQLDGATLVLPERDASLIPLDTPAWFAWLEHATTFVFRGSSGRFTARREQQVRGGEHCRA
jgi:hypothetical protein